MDSYNYAAFEGFETYGYTPDISPIKGTTAVTRMEDDLKPKFLQLNNNYTDLSNNITDYNNKRKNLLDKNSLYDFSGNTFFLQNKEQKTEDVILEDTNEILLQQNTMYTLGSILAVSLFIVALMSGASKES